MGEHDGTPEAESAAGGRARHLARGFEPYHDVCYYTREIRGMTDLGFKGWWHAYFAYRFAPMGPISSGVAAAAAYNFAPRMIDRAIPAVWSVLSPSEVIECHRSLVDQALTRIFGDGAFDAVIDEAAPLAREAIEGVGVGARPLFAGHADLPWFNEPRMMLWHACTLLREHRGDSHNIALAAADIDGLQCHVLMAARGHGNQPTLESIRGWTAGEWASAASRLEQRGWVDGSGAETKKGRDARSEIERVTDQHASEPVRNLGPERCDRLIELLDELAGHLVTHGEVAGVWPPPAVRKS